MLKRSGEIQTPSKELVHQVIAILDDDNIYYDARIIACKVLIQFVKNADDVSCDDVYGRTRKVIEKLKSTPQPSFFDEPIDRLYSELTTPSMLEN